jgi:uncharacterized protein
MANKRNTGPGRGWHGDPEGHARAGQLGGRKSGGNFKNDPKRASAAASRSSGNFKYDRERARAAGRASRSR